MAAGEGFGADERYLRIRILANEAANVADDIDLDMDLWSLGGES